MLGDALSYPRSNEDWLKTVLIGGILTVLSILVIPAFFLSGYFVRVLRSAAHEEPLPTFGDWSDLFVDGLKVLLITFVYVIIPEVLLLIGIVIRFIGIGTDSGELSVVGLVLILIASPLLILVAYILPVALTNFALTDSVDSAFEFRRIFGAAFTGRYFIAVVLVVVGGGILSMISALLSLIFVGIFLLFYVQVMIYYLYARGCAPKLGGTSAETSAVT